MAGVGGRGGNEWDSIKRIPWVGGGDGQEVVGCMIVFYDPESVRWKGKGIKSDVHCLVALIHFPSLFSCSVAVRDTIPDQIPVN